MSRKVRVRLSEQTKPFTFALKRGPFKFEMFMTIDHRLIQTRRTSVPESPSRPVAQRLGKSEFNMMRGSRNGVLRSHGLA